MKPYRRILSLLLIACSFLSACGNNLPIPSTDIPPTSPSGTDITPIDLQAGYGVRGPWFELYFKNKKSTI